MIEDEDDTADSVSEFISLNLRQVLDRQQGRFDLGQRSRRWNPDGEQPTTDARPIRPEVVCFPLGEGDEGEAQWSRLHETFTEFARGNLKPWYRCLSLLRGMHARTAVLETHYVCLDWRSEMAAFYSYLDGPRSNWTVRLHFFAGEVSEHQVVNLVDSQRDSYLGYIVLRQGELPLVGRVVLRLPDYLTEAECTSTAVTEPVHFFGQDLTVHGVPFMQQDSRLAVCAHLIVWMAHYTAYRRSFVERRLIADFVTSSSTILPMRPGTREGLLVSQVIRLIRDFGMSCLDFRTPLSPTTYGLPRMRADRYPDLAARVIAVLGGEGVPQADGLLPTGTDGDTIQETGGATEAVRRNTEPVSGDTDLAQLVWDRFQDLSRSGGNLDYPSSDDPAVLATDAVLAALLEPYLRSGLPVYLATTNHALLLCGSGVRSGQRVHYVHDDAIGPYLLADSLINMSRQSLVWQSGYWATHPGPDDAPQLSPTPLSDPVLDSPDLPVWRGVDGERGIENILVPTPLRAVLTCSSALDAAVDLIVNDLPLTQTLEEDIETPGPNCAQARRHRLVPDGPDPADSRQVDAEKKTDKPTDPGDPDIDEADEFRLPVDRATVTIMKGTAFKQSRREEALRRSDDAAVTAYASVHLAEWICLVQGRDEQDRVVWELAFDGTSSLGAPRIQQVRVFDVFVAVDPRSTAHYDTATLLHSVWDHVSSQDDRSDGSAATGSGVEHAVIAEAETPPPQ